MGAFSTFPEFLLLDTDFEEFSAYGFSIKYPSVCHVEFNPKTNREGGDIIFHYSVIEKIYLTWGDLVKARKRFPTVDEQAEHSVNSITRTRRVKQPERLTHDWLTINSHRAAYNHLRFNEVPKNYIFGKGLIEHESYSIHLQCEQTSRFFMVYSLLTGEAHEYFEDIMRSMANSFKCH